MKPVKIIVVNGVGREVNPYPKPVVQQQTDTNIAQSANGGEEEKPITFQDVLDQRFKPTNPEISINDLKSIIGYDFKFYQDNADSFNEYLRLMNNNWEFMQKWTAQLLADNQLLFKKTFENNQQTATKDARIAELSKALQNIADSCDGMDPSHAIFWFTATNILKQKSDE